MPQDPFIALSFLPASSLPFSFTVYRLHDIGQAKADFPKDVASRSLPLSQDNPEIRGKYWVSLKQQTGFEPYLVKSDFNQYLTRDFMHDRLLDACRSAKTPLQFHEERGFAGNKIAFVLKAHSEGEELVWLQAYYLKSARKFGFLIDYRFRKGDDVAFSKRVQQLSLSLDQSGKENRNFYSDRHDKVQAFISRYFESVFPLRYDLGTIDVSRKLILLRAESLERKIYSFCKDQIDNSQFAGLKRYCPLAGLDQTPFVFFVYRQQDRLASLDLYKSLRGETFPNVFPGTERMFGFPLTAENVKGISVSDFKSNEIQRVRDTVLSEDRRPILVVLIAPWNEEETEDSEEYFRAKYILLTAQIPSQVVHLSTLQSDSQLKWSTSNIALQCFAKLGGKPWKVKPRTNRCLIIGVGQSHRVVLLEGKRHIERYFAYSVLTDSSGLFKELRMLGRSESAEKYIAQLKENVRRIVLDHNESFDHFVIHAPYKISREELDSIKEVFDDIEGQSQGQFVVLRIDTNSAFFGYSPNNNSLVPFESTYVSLSKDDFLVWFEGLQFHNPKISRRYAHPVHIAFHYSNTELSATERLDYLQDALNLSGANWRGFNAKNMPVSVYYAQLIARFTNKFDELKLAEVGLDNLHPWFL